MPVRPDGNNRRHRLHRFHHFTLGRKLWDLATSDHALLQTESRFESAAPTGSCTGGPPRLSAMGWTRIPRQQGASRRRDPGGQGPALRVGSPLERQFAPPRRRLCHGQYEGARLCRGGNAFTFRRSEACPRSRKIRPHHGRCRNHCSIDPRHCYSTCALRIENGSEIRSDSPRYGARTFLGIN